MDALGKAAAATLAAVLLIAGCTSDKPKPYGSEARLSINAERPMVWAIAPAVDYSAQKGVDALLQADLVYQQLQEVNGLTIIPVNRTVGAMSQLGLDKLNNRAEVDAVCRALGCDGVIIPTVTAYDPYQPPKFGAALQLFLAASVPATQPSTRPALPHMLQAVGMFDGANGTIRERVTSFAAGREDPNGPLASKEHYVVMDQFCGFAWHELTRELVTTGGFGR